MSLSSLLILKAKVSFFSTKIEFAFSDWQCISGQCGLSCSLFEILKCCADQSDTKSKHAGVWPFIVAMTAQEWRLCTRLGAERGFFLLFFPQCIFPLPTILSSFAKGSKVLPSAQIQCSLSLTGLSYGRIPAHQLHLCIWVCRYLIAVLFRFYLNHLVKVNYCTLLQWRKAAGLKDLSLYSAYMSTQEFSTFFFPSAAS